MDPLAKATSEMVVEKTWQIPANGGKAGPVTLVVRLPNVLIIDSHAGTSSSHRNKPSW